jgi:hypothetical protein
VEIFAVGVLFVAALFNVVTWPRLFVRILADERAHTSDGQWTRFANVHFVLMLGALVIAAAAILAGVLLLL